MNDIVKLKTDKIYNAIKAPKASIALAVNKRRKELRLSLRSISNKINDQGFKEYKASYTQIQRVTAGEDYEINTLLKVLDALDLELVIKMKGE